MLQAAHPPRARHGDAKWAGVSKKILVDRALIIDKEETLQQKTTEAEAQPRKSAMQLQFVLPPLRLWQTKPAESTAAALDDASGKLSKTQSQLGAD